MQALFLDVSMLDRRCYDEFGLSEDILMEHAASSLANAIRDRFKPKSKVLVVCGPGNNGADGIALARMLHKEYDVSLYIPFGLKSNMSLLQFDRAKKVGVKIVDRLNDCDCLVDAIFGSGLDRDLDSKTNELIKNMNSLDCFKIACDVPTGLDKFGKPRGELFKADMTISMGALKLSLFSDIAKDVVGTISVANLGVCREIYETDSNYFLLDKSDLKCPFRNKKNTHKGEYGHLALLCGIKSGASILAGLAAFSFGCGLVSLVSNKDINAPYELMQDKKIPENANALCIGMGLGNIDIDSIKDELFKRSLVIDADLFYEPKILELIQKHEKIVLTPHPKEFSSLLKICEIGEYAINDVQLNRFELAETFSKKYPNCVLLLKGANTIIAKDGKLYINSFGTNALAKGGSGDVLAGLIGSLLAQKYEPLEATISGSLAHAIASSSFKNNYALTPIDLIKAIKDLKVK